MKPVLTVAEMASADARAAARDPQAPSVLMGRAGRAVAQRALEMLGGGYGRRVVVVAGPGNNGGDGRVAAARLSARGAAVVVVPATGRHEATPALARADLVIDAAFGTGFRGEYSAPDPHGALVLAVDIPSGVHGDTGCAGAGAVRADATVTFAALKAGLLFGDGRERSGDVTVADIGLDVEPVSTHVVEDTDVAVWLPRRGIAAHKWSRAVWVVAGSPGMSGAARLCSRTAQRAGAGMVHLGTPGSDAADHDRSAGATEAVARTLPAEGWDEAVRSELDRFHAVVVGPGLGRASHTAAALRALVGCAPVPVVVDADGLWALGGPREAASILRSAVSAVVITPHDGEFERLAGERPRDDRLSSARDLAARTGAVVLLKGPVTIVAGPDGEALLVTSGDQRLATAGTGDVLSGVIGAVLAAGLAPLQAAAAGAYIHGCAAHLGPAEGLVASDLPELIPTALAAIRGVEC